MGPHGNPQNHRLYGRKKMIRNDNTENGDMTTRRKVTHFFSCNAQLAAASSLVVPVELS